MDASDGDGGVQSSGIRTCMEAASVVLLGHAVGPDALDDLLDSEFSTLDRGCQHGVMVRLWVEDGDEERQKTLTARTRRSEVLPAFCRPIMVMSISVALDSGKRVSVWFGGGVSNAHAGGLGACNVKASKEARVHPASRTAHQMGSRGEDGAYQNRRKSQS